MLSGFISDPSGQSDKEFRESPQDMDSACRTAFGALQFFRGRWWSGGNSAIDSRREYRGFGVKNIADRIDAPDDPTPVEAFQGKAGGVGRRLRQIRQVIQMQITDAP